MQDVGIEEQQEVGKQGRDAWPHKAVQYTTPIQISSFLNCKLIYVGVLYEPFYAILPIMWCNNELSIQQLWLGEGQIQHLHTVSE